MHKSPGEGKQDGLPGVPVLQESPPVHLKNNGGSLCGSFWRTWKLQSFSSGQISANKYSRSRGWGWGAWNKDYTEGLWGFSGDLGVIPSNHRINKDDEKTSALILSKPREDRGFTQDCNESGAMIGLAPGSLFVLNLILLVPSQISFTIYSS